MNDKSFLDEVIKLLKKDEYVEAFNLLKKYKDKNINAKVIYAGMLFSKQFKKIKKDIPLAKKLLKEAVKEGDDEALRLLGILYIEELHDTEKAIYYLEKAIGKNNTIAMVDLGSFYQLGEYGLEVNMMKALNYYAKACRLGYEEGCISFNFLMSKMDKINKYEYIKENIGVRKYIYMGIKYILKDLSKRIFNYQDYNISVK